MLRMVSVFCIRRLLLYLKHVLIILIIVLEQWRGIDPGSPSSDELIFRKYESRELCVEHLQAYLASFLSLNVTPFPFLV